MNPIKQEKPKCDLTHCPEYSKHERCYVPYFRFCIDYETQSRQETQANNIPDVGSLKKHNPADTYEQIGLTEGLEEKFQREHPYLYHVMNRKLFKNWRGI